MNAENADHASASWRQFQSGTAPKASLAKSTHAKTAFLQWISTRSQKNLHFSSLFCGFSLRSLPGLAIVPCGPSFPRINRG
jgi:hypothetical protein